jgi:hypothetical protein
MNKLLFSTLIVSMVGLGGCAVDAQDLAEGDETTTEDALKTSVSPGTFKLYSDPDHTPSPHCDVFTRLELKASPARAELREEVASTSLCKLMVQPNERFFRLRQQPTGCGSKLYTGSFRKQGKLHAIKITDHRTRLCKDLVPAKIIVEETVPGFPGAITTTKYSFDGAIVADACQADADCGPGAVCQPGVCLLFCPVGDKSCCAPNKCVSSTVPVRVCPAVTTINCMPPTTNPLCGADRAWVQDNCPGVTYLD